ncbi:MAG: AAA family ATPase, partial [bacterium]|nr:AAA family ATPase [bacterium]
MTSSNLIGQEKAMGQLQRFLKQGIPQSLLFYGPEGVGKKTAAKLLVQTALCEEKTGEKPCHVCSSCVRLMSNNHPNCHLLAPEGTSHKIETIRQLLHLLSFKPYEEGSLFVLIDEAEKMTEAAANALLKTLEEPPPFVIFILITGVPGMLPATILSRCQKIS